MALRAAHEVDTHIDTLKTAIFQSRSDSVIAQKLDDLVRVQAERPLSQKQFSSLCSVVHLAYQQLIFTGTTYPAVGPLKALERIGANPDLTNEHLDALIEAAGRYFFDEGVQGKKLFSSGIRTNYTGRVAATLSRICENPNLQSNHISRVLDYLHRGYAWATADSSHNWWNLLKFLERHSELSHENVGELVDVYLELGNRLIPDQHAVSAFMREDRFARPHLQDLRKALVRLVAHPKLPDVKVERMAVQIVWMRLGPFEEPIEPHLQRTAESLKNILARFPKEEIPGTPAVVTRDITEMVDKLLFLKRLIAGHYPLDALTRSASQKLPNAPKPSWASQIPLIGRFFRPKRPRN